MQKILSDNHVILESYQEILSKLHSFERFGVRLGLERIKALLRSLGNPHKQLHFIHIAGTNGKGSVATSITHILAEAGIKTGLYTSPHLISIRERIKINNTSISRCAFLHVAQEVLGVIAKKHKEDEFTFFEVITAIAFCFFFQKKVSWVVLETGLGGRLDATNVVSSAIQIITSIEKEHTEYLGKSITQIACEKAGIIKKKGIVLTAARGRAGSVIKQVANRMDARLYCYPYNMSYVIKKRTQTGQSLDCKGPGFTIKDLFLSMVPSCQAVNCLLAITAIRILSRYGISISEEIIKKGMATISFPGRWSEISWRDLQFIVDGAHTPRAVISFVKTFQEQYPHKKTTIIFGICHDKNVGKIINELLPITQKVMVVALNTARSRNVEDLVTSWAKVFPQEDIFTISSLHEFLLEKNTLLADELQPIVVIGSLFLAGEFFKEIGMTFCGK
ncbi:bifunctional folylpolyglutamate synthase/dihydrofolate synthase [Chlamydiota bacterium]